MGVISLSVCCLSLATTVNTLKCRVTKSAGRTVEGTFPHERLQVNRDYSRLGFVVR